MQKSIPTKTTVVFTEPQLIWLKNEANKRGITFAEMVRRIVDYYRGTEWPAPTRGIADKQG